MAKFVFVYREIRGRLQLFELLLLIANNKLYLFDYESAINVRFVDEYEL